jgi:signal transduction histidine kinase
VYALVQTQIIEQYNSFSNKQQTIELEGEPFDITADIFSINILLKNLLDNASKYTPAGGNILLAVKQQGDNAILTIDDSGRGIAEALYGKVFERYYRINEKKAVDTLGSGLGFSIMHHILDLHNGDIILDKSCFATGLKVTIILPLNREPL